MPTNGGGGHRGKADRGSCLRRNVHRLMQYEPVESGRPQRVAGLLPRRCGVGNDYATEAASALPRWAFETLHLNRVQAETDTRNVASRMLSRHFLTRPRPASGCPALAYRGAAPALTVTASRRDRPTGFVSAAIFACHFRWAEGPGQGHLTPMPCGPPSFQRTRDDLLFGKEQPGTDRIEFHRLATRSRPLDLDGYRYILPMRGML